METGNCVSEHLIYSHMAATVAWHRSPGYDLRRTRRDLPDLTCNAAHGGINQRFLSLIFLGLICWCLFVSVASAFADDAVDLSIEQRNALQQMQSSEALFQQYQIDQQLLRLDRQKLEDGKRQGVDARTLRELRQTVDAAQVRLDADSDDMRNQQANPFVQQGEMQAERLQPLLEQRQRLQRQQEERLMRKKAREREREQQALAEQHQQQSAQQGLLLQQQALIQQQQNLLATQQNQTVGVPYWEDGGGWLMQPIGWTPWWGQRNIPPHAEPGNEPHQPLRPNRPSPLSRPAR